MDCATLFYTKKKREKLIRCMHRRRLFGGDPGLRYFTFESCQFKTYRIELLLSVEIHFCVFAQLEILRYRQLLNTFFCFFIKF